MDIEKNDLENSNVNYQRGISNLYLLFTNMKESKMLLSTYKKFVNNYYEAIYGYYITLTEMNCHFLSEDKFKSSIKNTPIFLLGKAIKNAIEAQIKHLFSIIENKDIFDAFNNTLSNLSKILQESSIKFDKKLYGKNIEPIVSSLMDSYREVELKVIDEYIGKKYKKHINNLNDESLEETVIKINYLEKTFLDFEEGSKRQFFNDLHEMENKTLKVFDEMKDIVENIIFILNKNKTEFLGTLQNEIKLIYKISPKNKNKFSSEEEENSEIKNNKEYFIEKFKYKIKIIDQPKIKIEDIKKIEDKEKEEISKDEDKENSKSNENEKNKVKNEESNKEKIIEKNKGKNKVKNKEFNEENNDTIEKEENDDNSEENNELVLKEQDIYDIVSTLYKYDFKMLNKTEYNLDLEKKKLRVIELSNKLLSFDAEKNINEIINDEEVQELLELLNNNRENIIKFFLLLNNYRSTGRYEATERAFKIMISIFNKAQDYLFSNKDTRLESLVIILSQTFYILKNKEKFYLQQELRVHPLFKKKEFWESHLSDIINEEIEKIERQQKEGKIILSKETKTKKIKEIILTKLIPISTYMSEFGVSKEMIVEIITPALDKYDIDEISRTMILSLIEHK